MTTTAEKIAVMQAHEAGKTIEFRESSAMVARPWHVALTPVWNWDEYDYRVKPEPLTLWVNEYPWGFVGLFRTKEDADKKAGDNRIRCIKMVEDPK